MNWDDLRFFLALAREGSVSGAGRALGVKHTTVARHIQALEDRLDTRLFDRSPDGYAMTQAAENIFNRAVEIEALTQSVDREAFGMDAQLAGPLSLTASKIVSERLIIPRLKTFTSAFPNINLRLVTTTVLTNLAARDADVAVRMTPKPPDYLIGRDVMPLQYGIYGTLKTLKNLSGSVDVILFEGDDEFPIWVTDNFRNPRVVMRTDRVSSMAIATRNHIGVSRMPCFIGDSDTRLRRLDVRLQPSDWRVWILSHVDLRATARVRVCRDFLFEIMEQQRPLIQGENSRYI